MGRVPDIRINPSILSADFVNMQADLERIASADFVHVDVMDGHFVPNLTLGEPIVKRICEVTDLPVDVHLMIVEPERYVARFAEAGADIVTFHYEATYDPRGCIEMIRKAGAKAGVSIKPATSVEVLRDINLTVRKGEVVSILGSSGSGKSTLLRCMNWLEQPDRGAIYIGTERIGIDDHTQQPMANKQLAQLRQRQPGGLKALQLLPHCRLARVAPQWGQQPDRTQAAPGCCLLRDQTRQQRVGFHGGGR